MAVFKQPPWSEEWDKASVLARLQQVYDTPGFYGLAAMLGDEMLGFAAGYVQQWLRRKDYYLQEMCVASAHQHGGIGTAILQALCRALVGMNVESIYLLTSRDSAAEAFYRKNGLSVNPGMIMMGKHLPDDVSLREFNKQDLMAIKRLIDRTVEISYAAAYPAEALAFFKDYHSTGRIVDSAAGDYIVVVEIGGEIVGTGTLTGTSIGRVFVDPLHQGKGWGELIMRRLEEKALAAGVRTVDLSASLVAKPFYDALGYATQSEDSIPLENEQELRYYTMTKKLGGEAGFAIRDATANDAELLASLIRVAFRDVAERFTLTPSNCPTHPSNCTVEWIEAGLEKGLRYYVLEEGENACGCVALEQAGPDVCYLERLAVLPRFRHKGYGRALVEHVLEQAGRLGAGRVELGIIAGQDELRAWYEGLGFCVERTAKFKHLPFRVAFMARQL
ncbi:MAG: GNAT family N-acetyltransferase [Thermoflexales bacterium]|nr:GNAT family N-acetyltransferase [Thermoflexales bacterium]